MYLTDLTIKPGRNDLAEFKVPVEVDENGSFSATAFDEPFEADNLASLERQLRDAALAARHSVPFVSHGGRRGVIRGYHAGNRDFLITWDDGEKGRMSNYSKVFRPGAITDEEVAEIVRLEDEIIRSRERVSEIQSKSEQASVLFAEAFGEDITSFNRDREVVAT